MIKKNLSNRQLLKALTLINTFQDLFTDEDKGIEFVAVYLADDATLKLAKKNPEALEPFIEQAEKMDPKEFGDTIRFFMERSIEFSLNIVPKEALEKITNQQSPKGKK